MTILSKSVDAQFITLKSLDPGNSTEIVKKKDEKMSGDSSIYIMDRKTFLIRQAYNQSELFKPDFDNPLLNQLIKSNH